MKRLLAMGAAVCAPGPVDGASLGTDEVGLRVPDHSYGVLMAP